MKNKIVAGNWKMNNNKEQTKSLLNKLKSYKIPDDVRIIVAPSFTQLDQSLTILKGTKIGVAAQNMNAASSGAFTGEVSAEMLKGIGVNSVIIGHSERRSLYHESDEILSNKVKSAIGGFCLINTNIYNNVNWDSTICEHHSFCEKVRTYGDIVVANNIKTFMAPEKYTENEFHLTSMRLDSFNN